jgi:hypothetical protein
LPEDLSVKVKSVGYAQTVAVDEQFVNIGLGTIVQPGFVVEAVVGLLDFGQESFGFGANLPLLLRRLLGALGSIIIACSCAHFFVGFPVRLLAFARAIVAGFAT